MDMLWQEGGRARTSLEACYSLCILIETCSKNVAEYNALLIGILVVREVGVNNLEAYDDSMLVVNQVRREYVVWHEDLIPYYEAVSKMENKFKNSYLGYLPC